MSRQTTKPPEYTRGDILGAIRESQAMAFADADKNSKTFKKLNGRDDLFCYAKYVDPTFEDPAHIRKIGDALMKVERGEIRRLMIFAPPRHGKTLLASKIFPSWFVGRNPKKETITAAYGAELAEEFTSCQRDICESAEFRDIFPKVQVRPDSRARNRWKTTDGGVTVGAGVDGPINGKGAHLFSIDDPFKNLEEALSLTIQEKAWNWYRGVARTRVYTNAAIVMTTTRWAKNDLAGKLLEQDGRIEDGGLWTVLKLPAIDENGNALWPERFPISELNEIRKTIGEGLFSALYQQEPIDIQEKLFENPNFLEPPPDLRYYGLLDPAFTCGPTSDFSSLSILGINNRIINRDEAPLYVTFGEIWRKPIDIVYDLVEDACIKNNVSLLYVECNSGGIFVYEALRKRKKSK
ncbi:Terminase-like family protein [Leptospira interrogans serovar Bataviae str. HAI135]|nr:Terminase-like family protein [Leptospira interrogans serovar Bataviae str. HAI135]